MAKATKTKELLVDSDDKLLANELINSINTTLKDKRAYNLSSEDNPTAVKYYISTGSILLDYIISNKRAGGIPAGRLLEISGENSTGKSLLALQILANTQKMGGLAIYLDTENATDTVLLKSLGIDIDKLVYIQPKYVEEVFEIIEHVIKKVKETDTNKPITVVWDSVAATPPKAELDGDYEQTTMGLGARAVSKGLRKITQFIGDNNVTLVFINQLKTKITSSKWEDPWITPYGLSIPFHASVRLRLTRTVNSDMKEGGDPKDKNADFTGVGVKVKVVKNKIAPPFRICEFSIGFYQGILEHNQIFETLANNSPIELEINEKKYIANFKNGAWHSIVIDDDVGTIYETKFRKNEIYNYLIKNDEAKLYIDAAIDTVLHKQYSKQEAPELESVINELDNLVND